MMSVIGRMARLMRLWARDRRGAVSPLMTLLVIPVVGSMALAGELGGWYYTARGAQNAADSAAITAATTNCSTASATCIPYVQEAKATAARYGFVDGASNVTVTPSIVTCPSGAAGCYQVAITKVVPINLARIVGFTGDTALGGGRGQTVKAVAIASPKSSPNGYCLLSLAAGGSSVVGISQKGGPKSDMAGCKIGTNGTADCKGHDMNADVADAVGGTDNCGAGGTGNTGVAPISDPFAGLASKVPANTCAPSGSKSTYTPASSANNLTGSLNWSSLPQVQVFCGDVTLTGNVNLTTIAAGSGGSVMVIENGTLNMNSNTLKTLAGSGLTIIFSGPTISGFKPSHILSGGGLLDIAAPTSGTWSGIAVYQDPAIGAGTVDWSSAGNSPTWNVTGLFYLSKAAVSFSGVVNKASNGVDCFAIIDDTFQTNGTSSILEHQSQCATAGLTPPTGGTPVRQALVQ